MQASSPSNIPRLPEGWSVPETVEDVVVADGLVLHRAGIAVRAPTGEEITGSAAETEGSPASRSYFELLERAATIEAIHHRQPTYDLRRADGALAGRCSAGELFPESDDPARWRYSRSNGVALHDTWIAAAERARWELVERDRLLRSWYGEILPVALGGDLLESAFSKSEAYDWRAYSFPESGKGIAPDVHVVGVFGFPHTSNMPLVLGYGARDDAATATAVATREALQLLAFLWGEPVATEAPPVGPSAMHHLELFQYAGHHGRLRRWLDGEHAAYALPRSTPMDGESIRFVDLTPSWMPSGIFVAKAYCSAAAPLAFGEAPFASHLPAELRAHPIA